MLATFAEQAGAGTRGGLESLRTSSDLDRLSTSAGRQDALDDRAALVAKQLGGGVGHLQLESVVAHARRRAPHGPSRAHRTESGLKVY